MAKTEREFTLTTVGMDKYLFDVSDCLGKLEEQLERLAKLCPFGLNVSIQQTKRKDTKDWMEENDIQILVSTSEALNDRKLKQMQAAVVDVSTCHSFEFRRSYE